MLNIDFLAASRPQSVNIPENKAAYSMEETTNTKRNEAFGRIRQFAISPVSSAKEPLVRWICKVELWCQDPDDLDITHFCERGFPKSFGISRSLSQILCDHGRNAPIFTPCIHNLQEVVGG